MVLSQRTLNSTLSKDDIVQFFNRATREAERYGEDSWVFLRELVQNSRDARATRIEFFTSIEDGRQCLSCRDNGNGMSRSDVEKYLLRLYSSSKEADDEAVGFFGVGFWSVLLFQPSIIRVRTRLGEESTAFQINCPGGWIETLETSLDQTGTEITLIRAAASDAPGSDWRQAVRSWLLHYAGPIRPKPGVRQLDLYCDGECLNQDFEASGKLSRRFRTRHFLGVLGFGPCPEVRIYKGGILVRVMSSLEEVIPSRRSRMPASGWGLFPYVAVNIDGLRVLMDRHSAFEDPVLHELVRFCEREFLSLHRRLVGQLFPLDPMNWFRSLSQRWTVPVWRRAACIAVVILVITITVWAIHQGNWTAEWIGPKAPDPSTYGATPTGWRTIDRVLDNWPGLRLDLRPGRLAKWAFLYEGGDGMLFQAATLDSFDSTRGLVPETQSLVGLYPKTIAQGNETIRVRLLKSEATRDMVLPVPPGWHINATSLLSQPGPSGPLWQNQFGEPVLRQPGRALIEYVVAPGSPRSVGPSLSRSRPVWPDPVARLLDESRRLPPAARVVRLSEWVNRHVAFQPDRGNAADAGRPDETWIERTLRMGQGDCDVVNGLLVLLLQSAEVPSRLHVGLVGEGGHARPELHAWAGYFDGGWQWLDLTPVMGAAGYSPARRSETPGGLRSTVRAVPVFEPNLNGQGDWWTPSLQKETAPSTGNRSTNLMPLWKWAAGGLALLLTAGLSRIWWRRHRPHLDEPRYLLDLFRHQLTRPGSRDEFKLLFRPIFPCHGGSRLSYQEILRLSSRGRLFAASPNCGLSGRVVGRPRILDLSADLVQHLMPFLPPLVRLDEMEPLLVRSRPAEPWQRLEAELSRWASDFSRFRNHWVSCFRIHYLPGEILWQEVYLPLRDSSSGRWHLFVGEAHPVALEIGRLLAEPDGSGLAAAMNLVAMRSVHFCGQLWTPKRVQSGTPKKVQSWSLKQDSWTPNQMCSRKILPSPAPPNPTFSITGPSETVLDARESVGQSPGHMERQP